MVSVGNKLSKGALNVKAFGIVPESAKSPTGPNTRKNAIKKLKSLNKWNRRLKLFKSKNQKLT